MAEDWSQLQVRVCANSQTYRKLVQQILFSIGIRNVDGSRVDIGSSTLVTRKHGLFIGQLHPEDMTILDVVKWLRRPAASPAPGIPVLISVNTPDRRILTAAIKAGVDLLVAEPLTIEKMEKRVTALLSNPPERLTARDYYGPDRRRTPEGLSPYKGEERRQLLSVKKTA